MDVGCNCFGVATAAKVPVKRYNLLVSSLFPVVEPPAEKELSVAVTKNIKHLADYLEMNQHRIRKVSRRLARRLDEDLSRRRLGFVHIAVEAFSHLLSFQDGKYSSVYARELIEKYPTKERHFYSLGRVPWMARLAPASQHLGSVVGVLLSSNESIAQRWGIDLFVKFMKFQNTAQFMTQLQLFIPMICSKAQASGPQEKGREPSIAGSSLRAILEYLRFSARISFVPVLLKDIVFTVLTITEKEISEGGLPKDISEITGERRKGYESTEILLPQPSIGTRVMMASSTAISSLLLLEEMARITSDPAEGRRVVEIILEFLDSKPSRWLGGPVMDACLMVLREGYKESFKRYLLVSMFFTHAGESSALEAAHRTKIISEALKDSEVLEPNATALLVALRELPGALMSIEYSVGDLVLKSGLEFLDSEEVNPRETLSNEDLLRFQVHLAIQNLSKRISDRTHFESVLGAAISFLIGKRQDLGNKRSAITLECIALLARKYAESRAENVGDFQKSLKREASLKDRHELMEQMNSQCMSDMLLRGILTMLLGSTRTERVLSHFILHSVLAALEPGNYLRQSLLLLSALYRELALPDISVIELIAIYSTFEVAGLTFTDSKFCSEALKFCLTIQREIIDPKDSNHDRWKARTLGHKVAVLLVCQSMWKCLGKVLDIGKLDNVKLEGLPQIANLTFSETGQETNHVMGKWLNQNYGKSSPNETFDEEFTLESEADFEAISNSFKSFCKQILRLPQISKHKAKVSDLEDEDSLNVFIPLPLWQIGLVHSNLGSKTQKHEAAVFVEAFEKSLSHLNPTDVDQFFLRTKNDSTTEGNGVHIDHPKNPCDQNNSEKANQHVEWKDLRQQYFDEAKSWVQVAEEVSIALNLRV